MREMLQDFPVVTDEVADWEVVTTDRTRHFISWETRNIYNRVELILGERCIESFCWEDQVELTSFLNQRERDSQS